MAEPTGQTLLELRSRRDHPDQRHSACPRCGADLLRVGIVDLAYVFDTCDCAVAPYTHLVEQLWHRNCLAADAGESAAAVLDARAELVDQSMRVALAGAHKAIMAEASRGERAAPARQHVTYPGGLRRAARIVDDLLGNVGKRDGRRGR